jgi:hypothetical protein
MKKIKLKYINQWTVDGGAAPCSLVRKILSTNFNVILDDNNPDYIVTQGFDKESLGKYNDKTIIFETGEAVFPNFNLVDYAIGYDNLTLGDRYFSFPYHLYGWREKQNEEKNLKTLKFCNFIYSNPNAHPIRDEFFHFLNNYKKIDSLGRHLNNVGNEPTRGEATWQSSKNEIQKGYKFTIAVENSNHQGYVTEKICDAFDAGTIPIYFGASNIDIFFDINSFVWIRGRDDFNEALKLIKKIDNDDELFRSMLSKKKLAFDIELKEKLLQSFVVDIFSQDQMKSRRKAIGTFNILLSKSDVVRFENIKLISEYSQIKKNIFFRMFKKVATFWKR